jgi:hypothetical protein
MRDRPVLTQAYIVIVRPLEGFDAEKTRRKLANALESDAEVEVVNVRTL